jgi:hypothetical protein
MSCYLTIRPIKVIHYDTAVKSVVYGLDAYWGEDEFNYTVDEKIPIQTSKFILWLAQQESLPNELGDALADALDPAKDDKFMSLGFNGPGLSYVSRERFLSVLSKYDKKAKTYVNVDGLAEWVLPILDKLRKLKE